MDTKDLEKENSEHFELGSGTEKVFKENKDLQEKLELAPPPLPSGDVDPEVYEAWKDHMINGYQQNKKMFQEVLAAFMRPYWMTVWMYRTLFLVGIGGFILAVVMSVWQGIEFGLLFGGLSIASFLTYFISQPLRSLEQNIHFITWLGVIYNTYWTRLMYANDTKTIQKDLQNITTKTIEELVQLVNTQAELKEKRPNLEGETSSEE